MDSVPQCPFLVKAIYSSSGEQKGDLGFIEGDIIEVLNLGDGNWWNGQLRRNKVIGQFPRNYVEFYTPKALSKTQLSKDLESEPVPIKTEDSLEDLSISINSGERLRSESPMLNNMIQNISQYSDVANSSDRIVNDGNGLMNSSHRESYYNSSATLGSYPSISERSLENEFVAKSETNSMPDRRSKITLQDGSRSSLHLKRNSSISSSSSTSSLLENDIFDAISCIRIDGTPAKPTLEPLVMPSGTRRFDDNEPIGQHYMDLSKLKLNPDIGNYGLRGNKSPVGTTSSVEKLDGSIETQTLTIEEDNGANNYEPFSPDSYKDLVNSLKSGITNPQRADTFKSISTSRTNTTTISSLNSSGMSILSTSSSDKFSLAYSKTSSNATKSRYRGISSISESPCELSKPLELEAETPVELPRSSSSSSSFPDLISQKIQLKEKSSGFLKKLFGNTNNTGNAGIDSSASGNTVSNVPLSISSDDYVFPNSSASSTPSTISSSSSFTSLRNAVSRRAQAVSSSPLPGFGNGGLLTSPGKNKDLKPPVMVSNSNKRPILNSNISLGSLLATPESDLDQNDPQAYIEMRRNVHRANTLTTHEKEARKKRYLLRGNNIIDPLYLLSQVEGDETVAYVEHRLDVDVFNFERVDRVMSSISRMPKSFTSTTYVASMIEREFGSILEKLRAIFVYCAEEISWEKPGAHSEYETDSSRVLGNKRASSYELAVIVQELCQAINVYCEVVRGYLKAPGEIFDGPGILKPNHSWNAVLINDEWRFIDCSLASPSHPARRCYSNAVYNKAEYFYFLTNPTEMIFTHVPNMMAMQHIKPPLDHRVAYALPLACPAAIASGIELVGFDNSSLRLEDYEVGEVVIQVPTDVEVVAEVQAGVITASGIEVLNESSHSCSVKLPALAQVFWKGGVRYYRIKALLPPGYGQGVLNIYAGEKGSVVSSQTNVLPIALSLPMTHTGKSFDYNFVIRHPTLHCKRQDIYICDPQCRNIAVGTTLKFTVDQYPSNGINAGAGFARTKLAIQAPSNKIYKLTKQQAHINDAFGGWDAVIKCLEVGKWRGLVLADTGSAWNVFAEWECT